MKKTNLFIATLVLGTALVSCGGGEAKTETADTADKTEKKEMAEKATWNVDAKASSIRWEGGTSGAQVYSHFGNIAVTEGKVMTEGGALVGGSFIVDMASMTPTDENYSEEHPASDLVGHLASEDFFAVESNPTAMFMIKSVEGETVTGDLTLRGKTNSETINISDMQMSPDGKTMTAKGSLVIDRQKYDVAWAHYLEDVVLSDDITLEIMLVATPM